VDVLEHEDGRAFLREPLEQDARRREQVLLVACGRLFEAEQVREPRLDEPPLLRVRDVLLECGAELRAGDVGLLVLEDPRAPAHHLGERPERDAVAV
jgi:hypothetical protein